jgi:putative addiction module CopG family antidote
VLARLVLLGKESKAMNINLTPEQEKIVKDELKSGHFRNAEEVIGEALQVLREKEQSSAGVTANGAQREAVREMLAFVEKNRVRLEGVSVKELIHEGHRL